ncbi:MAG: tetratricopeptide repeat protein, partial [candidate division KSB1 bacterium]|nr:tetratricopeptide repeat protein [candidate division KSB1 bacterium]
DQARTYYEQALAIAQELRSRAPDSADYARDLSISYERLGDLWRTLGNPDQARTYYEKALAIAEELRSRAPDSADYARDLVISYAKLAFLHEQLGDTKQARSLWEKCHRQLQAMKQKGKFLDQQLSELLRQLDNRG